MLHWHAPAGRWRILRLGASLTGQTNGPAPADSTGLEVDKLDGERVAAYLETHLARFGDRIPPDALSRFGALLSDSIEAGPQNWTDRILEHFVALRGYDPLRRLPALAGYLVGDADESDRFLFDYRRTLAELLSREYYGTLAVAGTSSRDDLYAEALEDGRPQLGDDLAMRSHADVPMGAMWTFDPETGPRPTYVADLKGAASVAHVYGRAWTGSEAFTSFGDPWVWSPQSLKHIADLQLCLGVTRFCIHTSAAPAGRGTAAGHRARSVPGPGVHRQRDLGRDGPSVDRLPRPLQCDAQRGSAGGGFRGVRRRGGARHRPVRRRPRYGGAGRVRLRLRRRGCARRDPACGGRTHPVGRRGLPPASISAGRAGA